MFSVDEHLLEVVQERLTGRKNIYWIIGAASSGKSTISRAISAQSQVQLYDMDAHVYGSYAGLYDSERHPANTAWLSAPNPLAWQLDLTMEAFDAFNRAASVEHFDLFSQDAEIGDVQRPVLVDGGITHPSLLAKIIPQQNIFCIHVNRAERIHAWESAEERASMKQWIFDLPDPEEKWAKFLELDEAISQTIVAECQSNQIALFERDEHTSVPFLAEKIAAYFGIELSPSS